MQAHPKAKTLKTSPLPFPDLCRTLFDGAAPTGGNSWGPTSKNPRPTSSSTEVELLEIDNAPANNQDGESPKVSTHASQTDCSKSSKPTSERYKGKGKAYNHSFEEERPTKKCKNESLEKDISAALKILITQEYSVEVCVEKLNKLGWDNSSSLYLAALGIFCEAPSYREAWMLLPEKNNELMKGWVKSIGMKLGYMV